MHRRGGKLKAHSHYRLMLPGSLLTPLHSPLMPLCHLIIYPSHFNTPPSPFNASSVPFNMPFHCPLMPSRGTGMIASSSTFRPHPGRVIRDLFRQLHAIRHGTGALVHSNHPREAAASLYLAIIFGWIASGVSWDLSCIMGPQLLISNCRCITEIWAKMYITYV